MIVFSSNVGPAGVTFTQRNGKPCFVRAGHQQFDLIQTTLRKTQEALRAGNEKEVKFLRSRLECLAEDDMSDEMQAQLKDIWAEAAERAKAETEELPPIGYRDERGYIEVGGGMKFHESLGIKVPLQTQDGQPLTPPPPPQSSGGAHRILPGSIEMDGDVITAAVHTGDADFPSDYSSVRYVSGNIRKHGQPGETVLSFMARVYDNSKGSILQNNFRMTTSLPERAPEPPATPPPVEEHTSSPIIDLEIQKSERDRVLEFLDETATQIADGYGAGNCNPESVAFWSSIPKTDLDPDWFLIHIELDYDNLSDHEIAAAVRKVTEAPKGEIVMFGKVVGRWEIKE